ncbi:hypothetical protein PCPL58_1195 [Pseudomonas cerasi]|uniref:Uncharacterized protein n=1 Tax=Pseudomonas cerasi TaxID=1583341 RepID=A0A193SKK0_9PSED|nr:hypothetical protein PCPL58_1195 [Pseudomonas cerasi]SOS16791.1 hypothetical protein PL963_01218 [Pseudomonas cerasi]
MAELVDAADSKSVFERSGSSILPRGTTFKKDLEIQGLFFRLVESGLTESVISPPARNRPQNTQPPPFLAQNVGTESHNQG